MAATGTTQERGRVATPGMPAPKRVALLVAAISYIGLFANAAQSSALAAGYRLTDNDNPSLGWQYGREALTIILLAWLANGIMLHCRAGRVRIKLGLPLLAFSAFLVFLAVRTVLTFGSVSPVLSGLRFFYVALVALCIRFYETSDRRQIINRLAVYLVPLLLFEFAQAIPQVLTAAPVVGQTAFGARPWGTYASPNNFGLAMLGFALVVMLADVRFRRTLLAVAGSGCLLSGSRAAIIGFALLALGALLSRRKSRGLALLFLGLVGYAVYEFASSPEVSGRTIGSEGRFATWANAMNYLDSFTDRLLGLGLGMGSNAQATSAGSIAESGSTISDSTIAAALLSMGIVGVMCFVLAGCWVWSHTDPVRRLLILPAVGVAALSFNLPELAPLNLFTAVAIGASLDRGPGRHPGAPEATGQAARVAVRA